MAKKEAAASSEPSPLLRFITSYGKHPKQAASKLSPETQPEASKKQKTKEERAKLQKGRTKQRIDEEPDNQARRATEMTTREIVGNIAGRGSKDGRGKRPCRFFFGLDVTGKSCCHSADECSYSHNTQFWADKGLTRNSVRDAWSSKPAPSATRSEVVQDGRRRDDRSSDSRRSRSKGRDDSRDAPRRNDEGQRNRGRSQSRQRRVEDRGSHGREQVDRSAGGGDRGRSPSRQ